MAEVKPIHRPSARRRKPLDYPDVPVDGLLRLAAEAWPDRTAIRDRHGNVTFAQLDARVSTCAQALAGLVGTATTVIGIPNVLDTAFATIFYGIARSGNVIMTINPRYPEPVLRQVLRAGDVRVLFLTRQLHERLAPMLGELDHVIVVDAAPGAAPGAPGAPGAAPGAPGAAPAGTTAFSDLIAGARPSGSPAPRSPNDLAVIYFTSGTTGRPKGVRLNHRNLVANAVQTADAHGLGTGSVVLNYLPGYHPMHLNAGVSAGATQVLCHEPDVAASIGAANRAGATHYYTLPMRLAELAGDPRLDDLTLDSTRVIFTGGSALSPMVANRLAGRFGIPVLQGYGLAETTAMTHLDSPAQPRPGSVGLAAADTDCRIVDIDTGTQLPPGEKGEIQVRGPQLMAGYLARTQATGIDRDGWLATGDVGYLDDDGYLFVVDRIKDVFTCDHMLVAPTEIEQVLARHPAVTDCVVVDRPDALRGAVPHALVVLADAEGASEALTSTLAEIRAFVADRLAVHQRLAGIEAVPSIPRSPTGKVERRLLRASHAHQFANQAGGPQ